jgi:hypothetical protein
MAPRPARESLMAFIITGSFAALVKIDERPPTATTTFLVFGRHKRIVMMPATRANRTKKEISYVADSDRDSGDHHCVRWHILLLLSLRAGYANRRKRDTRHQGTDA